MFKRIKQTWHQEGKFGAVAFLVPILIMIGVYLSLGIYPGSARSVLASDAFSQFSNFHASFNNVLHGEQSILYTWNASLGLNYWALISYYLGGIFTPIVFLFNNQHIPDALYVLTLIKIGAASLAFWFYGKETYRLPNWSIISLSTAYSLMSFITAHSELIMWLDIFMYLPLIILGINRVMDNGRSKLLFIAYLLLFISNFYFGFMIGLFSVAYFFARLWTDPKKYKGAILPYFVTSFLAGIGSMVMILPAVLDLRTNGETLTNMSRFKTEATAFWDIPMKQMIGVFDTTKYGSIPFIYVGLLPLIFCLFYFVSKKITLKQKLAAASLFIVLIASFYLEPLNLMWHGMHAPNMFLFRFSFLFSFLVVMLAGYGWQAYSKEDTGYIVGTTILLMVVFILAFFTSGKDSYAFVSIENLLLTLLFLTFYLIVIIFYELKKVPFKQVCFLLFLLVIGEAYLNTSYMLHGILDDWNYASRSLYSEPYADYKTLVEDGKKETNDVFYRLESLAPISSNDSFNYGYSGISMFSSIRNRHSSNLLNQLGFRSRGTNLNIRYQNNTLLMDSLMGIKHNISDQPIKKFGFTSHEKKGDYQSYHNDYALPLGFLTTETLYNLTLPKFDNLGSQTALVNQLAQTNLTYFSFTQPKIVSSVNTDITYKNNLITYKEQQPNLAKEITYSVTVPANKQAYISLYPNNFNQLKSSTATVTTDTTAYKTQLNITGQYYDLGYYPEETTIEFTLSLYGTKEITLTDPPVVLLDIDAYKEAMTSIQQTSVPFKTDGRKASATVTSESEQVLLTTIPYDEGWTVTIDGKQVETKPFQDGFLSFNVPKGEHVVQMTFTPRGLWIGIFCFIGSILMFATYHYYLRRKKRLGN